MVILYEHPLSPYAQKCKIALREKEIDFEARLPMGIGSGDMSAAEDFAKASPRSEVPALIDGDVSVFDSKTILEYIDENWPQKPMLPDSPAERARVRMLADVMDNHYEPNNWAMGEIMSFERATGPLAQTLVKSAKEQCETWFEWLEAELGSRDWFNGDDFGYGDLTVVPYINGSARFGFEPGDNTRLAAWAKRVNEREHVAKTAAEALEAAEQMANVADLVRQGAFKREYRDHRLEWMIRSGGLDVIVEGLKNENIRFNPPFKA